MTTSIEKDLDFIEEALFRLAELKDEPYETTAEKAAIDRITAALEIVSAIRRQEAQERVLKIRGSLDTPGFEACVEAELALMQGKYILNQRLKKTKGSSWRGRVCGYYSTTLTPVGYCIESENEPGSVQLYPETALEPMDDENHNSRH